MAEPELYFFDMDHTLINNDCDVSWKEFLVAEGIATADSMKTADYFFDEYVKGELDFDAFLKFQLIEFSGKTVVEMQELAEQHFQKIVKDRIYADGRLLVEKALATGKTVSLLTATNNIIAAPVARELGIEHICATTLEVSNGTFSGKIVGPYCGSEGKISHAEVFCANYGIKLKNVKYYGDSVSDKYILGAVGYSVAVNPGEVLKKIADEKGWEAIVVA